MFPNNSSKINVGQEFLNQTALKVLVWNNQSQSELRDKGDVIVT